MIAEETEADNERLEKDLEEIKLQIEELKKILVILIKDLDMGGWEGIVGQVAVTGKHQWICADNQITSSGPSFKFADGWKSQFSAGIRCGT
ncbi:hypothetical protein P8452_32166 [Trifolium repens]|nr:hypothetical protein P8452_32166 [Trifolium repens]